MKSFFRGFCFFLLAAFLFSFVPYKISLAALGSSLSRPSLSRPAGNASSSDALSSPSNADDDMNGGPDIGSVSPPNTASPNNASPKKQISSLFNISLLTKPQVIIRNDEETWNQFLQQLDSYQQANPFLLVYGVTDNGERVLLNMEVLDSSEVYLESSGSYNVYISFSVAEEYADEYELPSSLSLNSIPIYIANPAYFDLYYIGNTRDTMRFRYLYSVKEQDIELWYCKSELPLNDYSLQEQEWSFCHKNSTLYDSILLMPREQIEDQYFYYFQARTASESSYILSIFINNEQYIVNNLNGIRDESGRDEQSKPPVILPPTSDQPDEPDYDDENNSETIDPDTVRPENPKPPLESKPEEPTLPAETTPEETPTNPAETTPEETPTEPTDTKSEETQDDSTETNPVETLTEATETPQAEETPNDSMESNLETQNPTDSSETPLKPSSLLAPVTAALFDQDLQEESQESFSLNEKEQKPYTNSSPMNTALAESQSEPTEETPVTEEDTNNYTLFSGKRLAYLKDQSNGDSLRVTKNHSTIELPWSWKFFENMTDNSSLKVGIVWESKNTFLLSVEASQNQSLPAITLHLPWEDEDIPSALINHASGECYSLTYHEDSKELEVTVTESGLFSLTASSLPQSMQGMPILQDFSGFFGFFDWSFNLIALLLFISCIVIWRLRKI